jgi:hypothetical protein
LYLNYVCGQSNNQSLCYTWSNPNQNDVILIPIKYASSTGGQNPIGGFSPHYNLNPLFYAPLTPNSMIKIKITGPNIDQIITFNTSLGNPPIITEAKLYPWQYCI